MKKIILFSILAFCGISYSQTIDTTKSVVITQLSIEDRKSLDEAGWALKQYTTWHYVGTAGTLVGGAVGIIGATIQQESVRNGMIYAGLGIGIVGFLIQSFSPGFIAKAGNFLIKIGGQ